MFEAQTENIRSGRRLLRRKSGETPRPKRYRAPHIGERRKRMLAKTRRSLLMTIAHGGNPQDLVVALL